MNLLKITDKERVDEMCIDILSEVGLDKDMLKEIPAGIFWRTKTENCNC